jgi:hypothetical protein
MGWIYLNIGRCIFIRGQSECFLYFLVCSSFSLPRARACFSFNEWVTFYFAPRYYVDGLDRDADYSGHSNLTLNVTNGCIDAPEVAESGGWAFVWEKQFKLQQETVGRVWYKWKNCLMGVFFLTITTGMNFICLNMIFHL